MGRPDGRSARTGISLEDVQLELSEEVAGASGILDYLTLDFVVSTLRFRIAGGTRLRTDDAHPATASTYVARPHRTEVETLAIFRIDLELVGDSDHSWRVVGISQETRLITSR